MRRLRLILGVVLLCLSVQIMAQSQVDSVRIDVELMDDGSALVKETWVIDVDNHISEWYLGKENLGKMTIKDLSVTDETGIRFASEGTNWDIDRDREEKAHRCGLVEKNDGYEICWGVGSSGEHTYIVTYTMTGLVKGYSDMDGFNFMFMTPTDGEPESVSLNMRKRGTIFTSDSTHVWGFGFKGEANVYDGAVKYWSTEPFSDESRVIALVGFEKGIFHPEITYDKSFEDVKQEAFKGSDYKKEGTEDFISKVFAFLVNAFFVLLGLLFVGAVVWSEIKNRKRKKALLGGKEKDVEWFRGVPVDGNLKQSANIMRVISERGSQYGKTLSSVGNQNLIAAYMMRLLYRGAFQIVPQADGDTAFRVNELVLTNDDASSDDLSLELDLYNFFKDAAGNDTILQKKELKKWANKHGSKLYNWQQKAKDSSTLKSLNAKDVREVYGLKNFLRDFTLIQDRGAVEVGLWNNYLVFASLYGIADQVYKDFKKVCPEYFTLSKTMEQFQGSTPTVFWNTIGDTSRYFNRAATNYVASQRSSSGGSRWSGGGGSVSWGGGGGFSGGGHSGGR